MDTVLELFRVNEQRALFSVGLIDRKILGAMTSQARVVGYFLGGR